MDRTQLTTLLNKFVDKQNHSDCGDWPIIGHDEIGQFCDLIRALAQYKWGEDCDGDIPVRVIVTNRTIERHPADWCAIKHTHKLCGDNLEQTLIDNLQNAAAGVKSFADEVDRIYTSLYYVQQDKKKAAEKK